MSFESRSLHAPHKQIGFVRHFEEGDGIDPTYGSRLIVGNLPIGNETEKEDWPYA